MGLITKQELIDAQLDAQSLEDIVNGSATINGTGIVTTRLGQTAKTLKKITEDLATQDIGAGAAALINDRLDIVDASLLTLTNYNIPDVISRLSILENSLGLTSSGLPTGAKGVWFMKNYNSTYKAVPNLVATSSVLKLITRCPRGAFATGIVGGEGGSGGWLSTGGLTITERYANGRDGYPLATRAVFGAANTASIRYRQTFTLPAGTYTMVIDAKSNGSDQSFTMSNNGGASVSTFTATNTLQQFKREFTLASPATFDGRFLATVGGVAGDFTIDKAFLWDGNSASVPADLVLQGDMYIGNSSVATGFTVTGGKLTMPNGEVGQIDFGQMVTSNEVSLFAVVKRITAYNNTVGFRYPFLYTPTEGIGAATNSIYIGENEGENNLTGRLGTRSLATTIDNVPNIDDGQYHVIVFRGDAKSLSLWLEDVELQTNNLANGTYSLAKLQCGNSGGAFGMLRFEINALAFYDKRLTDEETRSAVNALIANAATSGISITKKKNSLIVGGDSITALTVTGYAALYKANASKPVVIQNEAIGGSMIELNGVPELNLKTRFPLHVGSVPTKSADITGRRFIHTIFIGANDLNSYVDNATFLAALWNVTTASRNAGAIVGVATILPRGSVSAGFASHNSKRAVVNPAIRAAVGTYFDFVIDFAASADMGNDADANNAAKYNAGDGIHPTSAGHVFLEAIYRAAVNPWLL